MQKRSRIFLKKGKLKSLEPEWNYQFELKVVPIIFYFN